MMEKFKLLFFFLIFTLFVSACQPTTNLNENSEMNRPQEYILHFGAQGVQDFSKYSKEDVDHQPAGMSFHSLDFSPPNLAKIKIENGTNSLILDNVFSVLGSQLSSKLKDGIQILDINAGLTKEEFVPPEQAYAAYVDLMKRINQAGWKNYFYRFSPRISKEDNLKYVMGNGEVIDPAYIFTFDEWKKVISHVPAKSIGYRVYANDILLDITLQQTSISESNQEQYMLRYSFQTIRYDELNSISDSDEMTANELEQAFQSSLIEDKQSRTKAEQEAKQKGYKIDENYQDPQVWNYVK